MTLRELLLAGARQWVVLLIGMGITVAGLMLAGRTERLYWSQTSVRFIPPNPVVQGVNANSFVSSTEALVAFTGLIAEDLNAPQGPSVSSLGPNILDVGIYDGTWIRLPDRGGQWDHAFSEAMLDVQVAGHESEDVRARTNEAVQGIRRAVDARQLRMPAARRVTIELTPPTPTLLVGFASPRKPMALSGVLGLSLTVGAAVAADGVRSRRGRSHTGRPRSD